MKQDNTLYIFSGHLGFLIRVNIVSFFRHWSTCKGPSNDYQYTDCVQSRLFSLGSMLKIKSRGGGYLGLLLRVVSFSMQYPINSCTVWMGSGSVHPKSCSPYFLFALVHVFHGSVRPYTFSHRVRSLLFWNHDC